MNAILLMLTYGVIIVPIDVIISSSPDAAVVIQGIGQAFLTIVLTVILFAPKVYHILTGQADNAAMVKTANTVVRTATKANPGQASGGGPGASGGDGGNSSGPDKASGPVHSALSKTSTGQTGGTTAAATTASNAAVVAAATRTPAAGTIAMTTLTANNTSKQQQQQQQQRMSRSTAVGLRQVASTTNCSDGIDTNPSVAISLSTTVVASNAAMQQQQQQSVQSDASATGNQWEQLCMRVLGPRKLSELTIEQWIQELGEAGAGVVRNPGVATTTERLTVPASQDPLSPLPTIVDPASIDIRC